MKIYVHLLGIFAFDSGSIVDFKEFNVNQAIRYDRQIRDGEEIKPALKFIENGATYASLNEVSELIEKYISKMNLNQKLAKINRRITENDLNKALKEEVSVRKAIINENSSEKLVLVLKKHCPNLLEVCGMDIAVKLIKELGFKELAMKPSGTILTVGAEKELFGKKNTKKIVENSVLFTHSSVIESGNKLKAARQLADKISIAAKKDYFKS